MFCFNSNKKKISDKRKEYNKFNNKQIEYAVERDSSGENVIGKKGGIAILQEDIVVLCEAHEVFRCKILDSEMAELMSHNGIDIKGIDVNTGLKRHIVAHYSYYRK